MAPTKYQVLESDNAHFVAADGSVFEVYSDVTLTLSAGEIVGVFGPNGCGKTTLLRSVAGIHASGAGEQSKHNSPQSSVAWVPQSYRETFFPWASLRTNCELVLRRPFLEWAAHSSVIDGVRADLGVSVDFSLRPQECSGGMLQQAALVRALATRPRLVLADEPFSALDFETRDRVRRGFVETVKRSGMACLVILHDPEDLVATCDRVLVIPGRPYSTNPERTEYQAQFVENQRLPDSTGEAANKVTFLGLAQQLLGPMEGRP